MFHYHDLIMLEVPSQFEHDLRQMLWTQVF